MSRRGVLRIAVAAAVLVGGLYIALTRIWPPSIPSHEGDGTFQDLTRRVGPIVMLRGYSINMPEFDLGNPHEGEYRLTRLANIWHEGGVYLAIRDPHGRWSSSEETLDGDLRLELLNSQGVTVASVRGRLGDYTWSGYTELHVLYQSDKSFFTPDSREKYRLRFWYSPDPRLAGYKGFVCVRSGGMK